MYHSCSPSYDEPSRSTQQPLVVPFGCSITSITVAYLPTNSSNLNSVKATEGDIHIFCPRFIQYPVGGLRVAQDGTSHFNIVKRVFSTCNLVF